MTGIPELLTLEDRSSGCYRVTQPQEAAEGRDVVYSGQILAQMVMASAAAAEGRKRVRSAHAVFARAGTYTQPIDMHVDGMHAGRTWASDTVTAEQSGRLLSRGILLLDTDDEDLMRHEPSMPAGVPGPESLDPAAGLVFPGAEWRPVPSGAVANDAPVGMAWHRFARAGESAAAHRAVLAWATCGDVISIAMQPHRASVDISEAHRTLSTGVIAHTIHFTDHVDVAEWLLVVTSGDKAGGGRILGSGQVFDTKGRLIAAFSQDGMAKKAERPLDPSKAL